LRIIADYCGLLQIIADYCGLLLWNTKSKFSRLVQ
jgi:hypothetical protein